MYRKRTKPICLRWLVPIILVLGCTNVMAPDRRRPGPPLFDESGGGVVALDQKNSTLNESGTILSQGFVPQNPHVGDAVVVTLFWVGSTDIIDSVTDYLSVTGNPPVGNTYTRVDYIASGGISMATYVATNVQNFPDAYNDPSGDSLLVVRAHLSQPVTDGGILLSAYTGVAATYAQALGAHKDASGSGSSTTAADPGSIAVNAGAVVYGVTMSNGLVGLDLPQGWTNIATISDASVKGDGEYAMSGNAGSVDPQWAWYFSQTSPGTWLATDLALNPAPPPALDQVNGTAGESGSQIIKGFNDTNPHVGDAIVATFFWVGSTNIIDSVTDVLTTAPSYTPVGNKYTLVKYVTAGGVSMATYVATNVRGFPDAWGKAGGDSILAVRAILSQPVTDAGIAISAYTNVNPIYDRALGATHDSSGSGSAPTTADPGTIAVNAGAVAYGVSLSSLLVGVGQPQGFTYMGSPEDAAMKSDAEYAVQASSGSVDPQWTWFFDTSHTGTWLAIVLALNGR